MSQGVANSESEWGQRLHVHVPTRRRKCAISFFMHDKGTDPERLVRSSPCRGSHEVRWARGADGRPHGETPLETGWGTWP